MSISIISKVALGLGLVFLAAPAWAATENVQWTNTAGVSVSGNSLTRNLPGEGWNAGASSTKAIASGDGFVEFRVTETTTDRVGGLSRDDGSLSFADIDYGFYLSRFGTLSAIEGGVTRPIGSYVPGDILRVAVEGGVVRYRKNGAHVETGLSAPTFPLVFDTALFHNGATITNGVISGDLVPAVFNSPGGYAVGGLPVIDGQGKWVGVPPIGPQGPKGDKGDKGDQGVPGPAVHSFSACGNGTSPPDARNPFGICRNLCDGLCRDSSGILATVPGLGCTVTSETGACTLPPSQPVTCPMCCVCKP